ncbi:MULTISPECIES: phage holin, lambda family [Winslowiella]|uniref:phage holin, lambda family n=1 Tax=Winslowiella TaxID=2997349 RepID=UPI0028BE8A21|nr:phage holin, lambda family [Winslowiella toletana]WNN46039.1 phage holin, lambda family [Winslowiella toletana]
MLPTTPWYLTLNILSDEHVHQLFNALIAASLSILFNIYKDCSWKRRISEGIICAMLAWFVVDLLMLLNISRDWETLSSVFIGLLGAEDIRKGFKSFFRNYWDKKS